MIGKDGRKRKNKRPSINYLRECFKYSGDDGVLYWRSDRPIKHFATEAGYKIYMARYAGRPCGSSSQTTTSKKRDRGVKGHEVLTLSMNVPWVDYPLRLYVHHIVWALGYGEWPSKALIHIDGNTKNNKLENLSESDRYENKSGTSGVYYCKRKKRWKVAFSVDGVNRSFGSYKTIGEAIRAEAKARTAT